MILIDDSAQGSEAWLQRRRGAITASRARDARDKLKNGTPSTKALLYAMDKARERCGGTASPVFANQAMRMGTEQEPFARMAYEERTGQMVDSCGFVYSEDGFFGCSPDGLVGDDGLIEIKTLVGSETLFTALVERDDSMFIDQIHFELWLMARQWCDLVLWAPDLTGRELTVRRIVRDEAAIEAIEADMLAFNARVESLATALRDAFADGEARKKAAA